MVRTTLRLITFIFCGACSQPQYLTEEDLKAFIRHEDRGLKMSRESNGYEVGVMFRPIDLLMLQETGGQTEVPGPELKRLLNKYKNQYYFILSLSRNNGEALYQAGGGMGRFSDLVQTLSFRMGSFVHLTTAENDTISVADYVYPRTYGMGEATHLMFAFDKTKARGKDWIQFNLREFGLGLGNQNFRFKTRDLEKVPGIDFTIKE